MLPTHVQLKWAPLLQVPSTSSSSLDIYEGITDDFGQAVKIQPCAITDGSALVAGLASGTTYYFWLVDQNSNVVSNPAQAIMPRGTPRAPAKLRATPGNTQVTLSWAPSPLYDHNVYWGTTADFNGSAPVVKVARTSSTYTVTGLVNGTTYCFWVTAVTQNGESQVEGLAVEASAVPVPTVPGPPTGLTAAPGDQQVTLSWHPPASDGGSPVTGYNVYQGTSPGGEASTPIATVAATSPTTSYTVPGLVNGTTYYFKVTALNKVDEGPGAEASAVPATVPGPPAGLTAVPGNGQVTLSWDPPASDGGSPVTGYHLYVRTTAGFNGGAPLATVPGTAVTVTGLTNGITYYFRVTAVNQVGEVPGAEVRDVPVTVPGPPAGLTAVPGDGQVTLSWAAPASDGGSPVSGYIIYRGTSPGGETGTPVNGSPVTATSYTVTGLTNGTTYYFKVVAVNAAGLSPLSNEASATLPPIVPSSAPASTGPASTGPASTGPASTGPASTGPPFAAPAGLTATAGDTRVRLSWAAPASDGGSSVTSYKVYIATVPGVQGTATSGSTNGTDATVTGLTNGTVYYFTVSAVNATGSESPFSTEVSAEPLAASGTAVALRAPTPLIALLTALAAMAAATVFTLIARTRHARSARTRQQMAAAPDVRAVPDTSRPEMRSARDTGQEPTHTVRLEPHRGVTTTTIKEGRP
ncbi:MAG TPA: fibronectin type III domain-containing protein [Streptosporangiaceae bacterium]|nr:fibronectin type III domain-containing protein [Streptosporangiaceae bacterium]